MGWWGEGIMCGDSPLDVQGDFNDKFQAHVWDEDEEWFDTSRINPNAPYLKEGDELQILTFCDEKVASYYDPYEVYGAVGFTMMECGWPMSDELKTRIIEAVDGEDTSGWGNEDVRLAEIENFKEMVRAYDGTRKDMPRQPGLFEKIFSGEE